jgi:Family of unknown function (DUF6399)
MPDVFHLIHALVQSYALAIGSRLRQARQALQQAEGQRSEAEAPQAQAMVEARAAEVTHGETVHRAYRHHLESVSLTVHPWRVCDSTRQRAAEVERQLHAESDALEARIDTNGLPGTKQALDKVRKQLVGVSALVDVWWQGVEHDLQQVALTPNWTKWVEEVLLPLRYGQEQVARTRCPRRKAPLVQALVAVQQAFDTHPITQQLAPEVLEGWHVWAAEQAQAFQRASSAVEGRNGYLSQMQHNQRGLPTRRSKVWTVLHNFDCRAADGTTPAARFFRRSFPDLFETVLSHIDDLPRSRKRNQAVALTG